MIVPTNLKTNPLGSLLKSAVVVFFLVVASSLGSTAAADDAGQDPGPETPITYKDKSAAQWIGQLRGSRIPAVRSEAAEALGFLARETKQTFGGFSDVPIDSAEPAKISEEDLRPIVAALVVGLGDRNARVRASSAVAVSWVGPRAKAAVPALIRMLPDPDAEAQQKAVTAIGRIGPPAKEAAPRLVPLLAKVEPQRRVEIAGTLRRIEAAPEAYVSTLIQLLAQEGYGSAAHYAAMELGQLGDPAVDALRQALADKNPVTRQNAAYTIANMAGWGKLTKDREAVADLLITLTRDDNVQVVWHAAQAIGSVHAVPARSVPALVALLAHADQKVANQAVDSLGAFGAEAKTALPALIGLLGKPGDAPVEDVARAIREIGIDRVSAEAISAQKLAGDGSWLFIPLCEYPEFAVEFLQANPDAVDVPRIDRDMLIGLIHNPDPRFRKLRELLYANEQLPLAIVAQLGDARFLPLLERKLKAASAHERTRLEASARACGAPEKRVVAIDESREGDFKPKSAWPETDPRRMDPDSLGHGDGLTEVIVTGRILMRDGSPALRPKFYRVNDAWLLGQRVREASPIIFDGTSGRFVFVTDVFAAYSSGKGQPEPGPYQTGSSMVLIEADGCRPLQVRFYDEMPEVVITLSPAQAQPK